MSVNRERFHFFARKIWNLILQTCLFDECFAGQQYTISEHLPASSYVTCLGWIVIWSYVLLGASVVQSLVVSHISEIAKCDKMMKGVLSSWRSKIVESAEGKEGKADDAAREVAKAVLSRKSRNEKGKPKEENLEPLVEEVRVEEIAAILGCSDALLPADANGVDPKLKARKGFLALHRFGSFRQRLREHGINGLAQQIRKKIVANTNIAYLLINKLDEKCMVVFPLVYTLGLVYICWPTQ